jgi:hypothetical protein
VRLAGAETQLHVGRLAAGAAGENCKIPQLLDLDSQFLVARVTDD